MNTLYSKHKKNENSTPLIIKSRLRELEEKVSIITRLRKVRNELLSNGAYHEKNLEEQMKKLEKVNIPENEKDLVIASSDTSYKLSHKLMFEYNELIAMVNEYYKL